MSINIYKMKVEVQFVAFLHVFVAAFCEQILFPAGKVRYSTSLRITRKHLVEVSEINNELIPDAVHAEFFKISEIKDLYRNAVNNLTGLEQLQLINCGIAKISPGAFNNVPKLAILKLQDNNLTEITAGIFNNLAIAKLYLHRNNIEHIEKASFDDMPNLFRIKLNSNALQVWDSDWFKNCPMVTEVYVRRNDIQEIPENAFKNIKGAHDHNGSSEVDTKIFLSKNAIRKIHPNALNGLEEFDQFWIDRNDIQHVDKRVFANVRKLSLLVLAKNNISSLDKEQFPKLQEMKVLDLTKNNLTCLPYSSIEQAKLVYLEKNKMDCVCVKELKSQLEANGASHQIIYSKC